MKVEEIRKACGDGVGNVTLHVPRLPSGKDRGIRLTLTSGPIGYVLRCVDGHTVARFSAAAVLRWLDRMEVKR